MLCRNLRSSRRGAAGELSRMTTEHLRPLLHEGRSLELFSELCSRLVQAKVPQIVVDMVRSGRLTALNKPDGGVRGIMAGDVIRRLVARTMAQQMAEIVEQVTATTPVRFVDESRVRMCRPCVAGVDGIGPGDHSDIRRRHWRLRHNFERSNVEGFSTSG